MDTEHGLDLPRRLQVEFSKQVQAVTEDSGTVIRPGEMWDVFSTRPTSPRTPGVRLIGSEVSTGAARGAPRSPPSCWSTAAAHGDGRGQRAHRRAGRPRCASDLGVDFEVKDYSEHALTAGSGASAVAYVEAEGPDGSTWWGVGMDSSILDASLHGGGQRGQPDPVPSGRTGLLTPGRPLGPAGGGRRTSDVGRRMPLPHFTETVYNVYSRLVYTPYTEIGEWKENPVP
jgi:hypothetical protein